MWKWIHRGLVGVLVVLSLFFLLSATGAYDPSIKAGKKSIKPLMTAKMANNSTLIVFPDSKAIELSYLRMFNGEVNPTNKIIKLPLDLVAYAYLEDRGLSDLSSRGRIVGLSIYSLRIRHWAIAILTAIYPAIFFIRSNRRRHSNRRVLQPCSQCSYDLYGNESGACPECGTVIAQSTNKEVTD